MEILNDSEGLEKLYLQLQDGFPVIVPTDTNYNLCSLLTTIFVSIKYLNIKSDRKISHYHYLLISQRIGNCMEIIKNTEIVDKLVEIFWPGPLNIILKNKTSYNYMLNKLR
ncbi:Sua5/YciO/YrdC/YwlC family protein [Staphylococcus aureus]